MDYGALVLTSRVTGIAPPHAAEAAFRAAAACTGRAWCGCCWAASATSSELAGLLDIPAGELAAIAAALERDGLALRDGDPLTLP